RSFSFQEFSQRYAEVEDTFQYREARLQDTKNRQNSIRVDDPEPDHEWRVRQAKVFSDAYAMYHEALERGIAKEVARALLPEGLTKSRMYMSGTIRSWIHYLELRTDVATQKEHRDVAWQIYEQLFEHIPTIMETVMENRK